MNNIAFLGIDRMPSIALLQIGKEQEVEVEFHHIGDMLNITGIEQFANSEAWISDLVLQLIF